METFMPSEIARLVIGYLEEQKCDEAAKLFLEASPLLHECRMVQASGKTFRRLVREMTLVDVFDKYCSIISFIQERLNKIADSDQVKQCGDFLEQLRFLIDGSRSQRFVVNINVPSQNSATNSGGSPIISSSIRKRQRSGSDRDRCKRFAKLQQTPEKQYHSDNIHCDKIEATPAESLPGYIDSTKSVPDEGSAKQIIKEPHIIHDEFNDYDSRFYMPGTSEQAASVQDSHKNEEKNTGDLNKCVQFSTTPLKCSMSTDTQDLIKNYQTTGTQPLPWVEILDYEDLMKNETLENLSLLKQGLLHCKEIQEQIAENINKSGVLPTDATYKDEGLVANPCILNNSGIFKSIVEETMVTPSFRQFVGSVLKITDSNSNTTVDANNLTDILTIAERSENKIIETIDNEVRNFSSIQRCSKFTNESKEEEENEGINISDLNDQNNAAIQSIINANSANSELKIEKTTTEQVSGNEFVPSVDDKNIPVELDTSIKIVEPVVPVVPVVSNKPKIISMKVLSKENKFSKRKEKKPVKVVPVPKPEVYSDTMITPTLVVCAKDEPGSFMGVPPSYTNIINPQYLKIAPKSIQIKQEPVYFKHVNVPKKVPKSSKKNKIVDQNPIAIPPVTISVPVELQPPPVITFAEEKVPEVEFVPKSLPSIDGEEFETKIVPESVKPEIDDSKINPKETNLSIEPVCNLEKITLYGNETSAAEFLGGNEIETLNVDASMTFSLSGLSPFLKMNRVEEKKSTEETKEPEEEKEKEKIPLPTSSVMEKKTDLITKRTPKSIIKSRSKNHRLSLSTPRRRHSHVRALDFGTPPKSSSNSASKSTSKISPSVRNRSKTHCRTSLFKSPPFVTSSTKTTKSPPKEETYKIPIATRSPAPKLMGGWEKFTGMDMILGKVSPNENSNFPPIEKKSPPKILKSWDAELRLMANPETEVATGNKEPSAKSSKRRSKNRKDASENSAKKKQCPKKATNSAKKRNSSKNISSSENKDVSANISSDLSANDKTLKDSLNKSKVSDKNESLDNSKTFFPSDKDLSFTLDESEIQANSKILSTPELIETLTSSHSKTIETKSGDIVKKYAKVVTIPRGEQQQNVEFMKTSPNYSSKIMQLETPRKLESSKDIPPTPRFLSPNSSSITPFTKVRNEDSSKIPDLFPTPDFAPTPGCKLTPNLVGDNTKDALKKGEFSSCSPYYQPSSETNDVPLEVAKNAKSITKVEEFQVVKVNLGREEAAKEELIISSSVIEVLDEKVPNEQSDKSSNIHSSSDNESDSDSDTSSSYSSRSSSSSSSNSNESSDSSGSEDESPVKKVASDSSDDSSCEAEEKEVEVPKTKIGEERNIESLVQIPTVTSVLTSAPATVPTLVEATVPTSVQATVPTSIQTTVPTSVQKLIPTLVETSVQKSIPPSVQKSIPPSVQKLIPTCAKPSIKTQVEKKVERRIEIERPVAKEASPLKMFSVVEQNDDQETPAKNDLLVEATISETPSSSKAGTDITTNLTSKISEIITSEENLMKTSVQAAKSTSTLQPIDYDQLKMQLDSKRERLKKGFVEATSRTRTRAAVNQEKRRNTTRARSFQSRTQKVTNPPAMANQISTKPLSNLPKLPEIPIIDNTNKMNTSNEQEKKKKETKTRKTPRKGRTPKKGKKEGRTSLENQNAEENKLQPMEKNPETEEPTKSAEKNSDTKLKEIIIALEDEKLSLKAKVDLVKRDLFSDDEQIDQRRTRSKSRQTSENQKIDNTDQNSEQSSTNEKLKENLPCVLESLELVPKNNKNDSVEEQSFFNAGELRHGEYHFIYDETTAVNKVKRKRKYSFTDVEIDLDNGDTRRIILAVTPMEEIYNVSPKPKKRAAKKSPTKTNNNKKLTNVIENYDKPLASSSPILKNVQSTALNSKNVQGKNEDLVRNDNIVAGKVVEKEKPKSKTRKRKMSVTDEPEHTKAKVNAPENLALLRDMEVEKLLSYIHGEA